MHGKILIVDPIATNRIVLKVKLSSAYYEVSQATSIKEATEAVKHTRPDVVITACTLEDGSADDLARSLRLHAQFADLPIIAFECSDNPVNRLAMLSAGIDIVLNRPINDALLLAGVRSLVRMNASNSEWRLHEDTSRALGFAEQQSAFSPAGKAVLVAQNKGVLKTWQPKLADLLPADLSTALVDDALDHLGPNSTKAIPDVFILVMGRTETQKILQLLATLKSHVTTRNCGVLVVQTYPNQTLGAQALDMGANDLMPHGFHPDEMALRIHGLLKRKQQSDQMRATVRNGLEAAVSDPLTGLHNRRYAMPHLDRIARHAGQSSKPFAVMIADMDHFKRINDTFGHAAGDAVLVETAKRLRENLRGVDLVARIGGEEFLIVLPGASLQSARNAARRLRKLISDKPFEIAGGSAPINATISIGLSLSTSEHEAAKTADQYLDEADKALYRAKNRGRNCVTLSRPAA
jgi:two-component system cell cycle response regulator